ncbi:MAG TPA: T9SS type A sorting domain-containing protein, partial [Cytophagaceae bacterium]|nr:T9SS type A sorting domain-containing protein [Cytophagaceae bacterium]
SIHLAYSADNVEINKRGELEVKNEWGKILEERPYAYQNISGRIKTIQVQYRKIGNKSNHIGFKVIGEYDTTRALIIDPAITLSWLTYYGTTAGGAPTEDGYLYDLDIDNAGNIYTTGWYSSVFPATAGAYMTASPGGVDAYASKLDPTGSILIWATFLGGGGVDRGWGIRVDAANNVYVAGVTENTPPAYPTTAGAFQTAHAGGTNDVFLSKLNSTGSALLFSTFIGGTNNEEGRGIDVDASGNTYITGFTNSVDYKTQGPIQAAFAGVNDAFVTKVNSTGTALLYSTYLGGDQDELGWDIVVDASNIAYVTGYTGSPNTDAKPFPTVAAFQAVYGGGPKDVFVTKVNAAGSAYVFSTYLGGGNIDQGNSIRLSAAGEVVVGGTTYGAGFPLVANLQTFTGGGDGFVAKFNVAGSALSFSTPYGGSNDDLGLGIAVKNNLIILKTAVMSNDITTTGSPYQATKPANDGASLFDVALAVYDNTSGSYLLTYASYFGGYLNDYDDLGAASLAIDNSNCLIVGATTHSLNLPVTAGVYQTTKNTANNVTPDQPFVFKLCNIPLPVTLISFTATQQQDNSALVQWTTGYEKNNDYFVVERSTDGINFTPIGTVKGDGNSSSSVDYSFVDPNGNIPVIYYRLKQVDVNGQFEYSQIIVLYPGKAHTISIESGSLQGTFTVNKIFLSQASIEILVIDALGREIIHTSKEAGAGSFQETIDLRKFSSGVYIIHAFSQDDNKISKVIKE